MLIQVLFTTKVLLRSFLMDVFSKSNSRTASDQIQVAISSQLHPMPKKNRFSPSIWNAYLTLSANLYKRIVVVVQVVVLPGLAGVGAQDHYLSLAARRCEDWHLDYYWTVKGNNIIND